MVAELLGIKTFLNEFVAYAKFSEYIKNRELALEGRTISVSCADDTVCRHVIAILHLASFKLKFSYICWCL